MLLVLFQIVPPIHIFYGYLVALFLVGEYSFGFGCSDPQDKHFRPCLGIVTFKEESFAPATIAKFC